MDDKSNRRLTKQEVFSDGVMKEIANHWRREIEKELENLMLSQYEHYMMPVPCLTPIPKQHMMRYVPFEIKTPAPMIMPVDDPHKPKLKIPTNEEIQLKNDIKKSQEIIPYIYVTESETMSMRFKNLEIDNVKRKECPEDHNDSEIRFSLIEPRKASEDAS